jgi:nucleotide-binding universal stress UspA family protein
MIARILVGLDGSDLAESALPYVEVISRAASADVILLRAVQTGETLETLEETNPRLLPYMAAMPTGNPEASHIATRAEIHEAEAYLDAVARRLGQQGLRCQTAVVAGDPAEIIVDEAGVRHADLIALSTHGRSGLGRWIFGSVAERVLATSPVPILLVRVWKEHRAAATSTALAPILVPLDGSPLAEAALPWAGELARLLAADLVLVRVVPPPGLGAIAAPLTSGTRHGDRDADDEQASERYLEGAAAPWREQHLRVTTVVRLDRPASGIIASAAESGAGLVVMATHGRTGASRTFLGSVALEVLHRGSLPVMLVRPNGLQ